MLNLQFAETMELIEAELQAVSGGWEVQEFTQVGEIKE